MLSGRLAVLTRQAPCHRPGCNAYPWAWLPWWLNRWASRTPLSTVKQNQKRVMKTGYIFLPVFLPAFRSCYPLCSGLARVSQIIVRLFILKGFFGVSGQRLEHLWRRKRDSNPRYGLSRTHAFQACTFSHSVISPAVWNTGAKDKPEPGFGQICFMMFWRKMKWLFGIQGVKSSAILAETSAKSGQI